MSIAVTVVQQTDSERLRNLLCLKINTFCISIFVPRMERWLHWARSGMGLKMPHKRPKSDIRARSLCIEGTPAVSDKM